MRKTFLLLCCGMIILIGSAIFVMTGCDEEQHPDSNADAVMADKITKQYAIPPLDITPQSQALADTFSWKTFIAMNWPANGNTCGPDTSDGMTILSGARPVVWETYLSSDQVFVEPGKEPQKWCEIGNEKINFKNLPQKIQDLATKTGVYRFIHRTSKVPHSLKQASGQPLVDQNGRFVRYEIRMNKDEYNYIMAKSLWTVAGQKKFVKDSAIDFPSGPTGAYGPTGAMEFKAAWKVLGKGDDFSRFYTIKAIVFNDDSLHPSPGENPVTLGLVGLHIAHKTATQHFWVWSTFEHVDNLTSSFYNPNCKNCPVNQPLPLSSNYKELDEKTGKPLHKPTQVKRVLKVDTVEAPYVGDSFVGGINAYFQKLLKGSVWANYALVSTQWELNEDVFPNFLANTVQETYLQGNNPPSYGTFTITNGEQYFQSKNYHPFSSGMTSSCMGCHYKANLITGKDTVRTDFSFMLGEAR